MVFKFPSERHPVASGSRLKLKLAKDVQKSIVIREDNFGMLSVVGLVFKIL